MTKARGGCLIEERAQLTGTLGPVAFCLRQTSPAARCPCQQRPHGVVKYQFLPKYQPFVGAFAPGIGGMRQQPLQRVAMRQPHEQGLALTMRSIVQPLYAALAEQRGPYRLGRGILPLETVEVIEQGGGLWTGEAERALEEKTGFEHVARLRPTALPDEAVRVGEKGNRVIGQEGLGLIGHGGGSVRWTGHAA